MDIIDTTLLVSSFLCLAASTIILGVVLSYSGILSWIASGIKKACVWFINLFLPNERKIDLEPPPPQITIRIMELHDSAQAAVSESGESGAKDGSKDSGIPTDGDGTLQADCIGVNGDGAIVSPEDRHPDR